MKKTKLLTSLVALALVLGLGACGETEEDTTTGDENSNTSQSSGSTDNEPTAYALVGDFVDASWDNEPAEDSKYYIAPDATSYEVTVETGSAPEDTDDWAEWGPWNAGLRVVEYGTWNLVAGYGQLDAYSTGVLGEGSDNNIGVDWNSTYDLTITLGENPSILVELVEEEDNGHIVDEDLVETPLALINKAIDKGSYSLDILVYEYDTETFTAADYNEGKVDQSDLVSRATLVDTTRLLVYISGDVLEIDEYVSIDDAWTPYESDIAVNYEGSALLFSNANEYSFDEYTYEGYLYRSGYEWADLYYTLYDLEDYFDDTDFTYIGETDDGAISYDLDADVAGDLALCTGYDYWYDSSDNYAAAATLDYLYFYPALQEITTYYSCGRWADAYVDNTGGSSDRYYFGYDFAIDIFNVGTTDLTAVAESLIELIPAE